MADRLPMLEERQKTHGSFAHHAGNTQRLKVVLKTSRGMGGFNDLSDEHKEALEMIVHKIGRILAGNPNFEDHWLDIVGYAELGREACKNAKP